MLNWNGFEVTRECLESLEQIDYPNASILVIDNGSSDGSPEKLRREFPNIPLICNERNLGFTGGNNVGIRVALEHGAEYVLLLNNDTVVAPGFLSEMIRAGESDHSIGLLNPKILYFDAPTSIWYAGGNFSRWRGVARHCGHRKKDQGEFDQQREVSFITGCAFLIRSEVILKIGLLDEQLFYTAEDTDWSIRALGAGYKAVYVPTAVIWHKESIDTKRNAGKGFRDFYNMRNTLLVTRKHARLYHWPSVLAFLFFSVFYRTAGYLVRFEVERVFALHRGIWMGLTEPLQEAGGPMKPKTSGIESVAL